MRRIGVAAAALISLVTVVLAPTTVALASTDTGFSVPFSGPGRFEYLAPTQATDPGQINQQLGQQRADAIAERIGLDKTHVLTEEQYRAFISGGGNKGDPASAALADRSVQIFINTTGNPLRSNVDGVLTKTVLGSYGLFVDTDGRLMSLANRLAPTRIANRLLAPGGYINTWFLANRARRALVQLYRSAYLVEAAYGNRAQQTSGPWQLVTNTKNGVSTTVGMSMAPALWLTNFALLYTLKPSIAAQMPANWTPIPEPVAGAIRGTRTGFVPYGEYASYFDVSS
jgi:hypothetical protein